MSLNNKKILCIAFASIFAIVVAVSLGVWIARNEVAIGADAQTAAGDAASTKDAVGRLKSYGLTPEEARAIIAKYPTKEAANPQFVLFAFDGSRSLAMWRQSLQFAREMNASNAPLHFTYFINAVYLLDPQFHSLFASPGELPGVSNIGFATSREDVLARIEQINAAYKEGHEIGSHNVGHYEGETWSFDEWMGQFDLFDKIVLHPESMRPEYHIDVPASEIVGFRAPDLSVNDAMYAALKQKHFLYDASRTAIAYDFPYKDKNGLWELPLPSIAIGPKDKRGRQANVLAMDYNFFFHDTKGENIAKKGTALWNTLHDQTVDAFLNRFKKEYSGARSPIYFASHFSNWNDGAYWESMKDFARAVCGKPEVYCVTYKDLAMWMEAKETVAKQQGL